MTPPRRPPSVAPCVTRPTDMTGSPSTAPRTAAAPTSAGAVSGWPSTTGLLLRSLAHAVDRALELVDDRLADVEVLAGAELDDGGEDEREEEDQGDVLDGALAALAVTEVQCMEMEQSEEAEVHGADAPGRRVTDLRRSVTGRMRLRRI